MLMNSVQEPVIQTSVQLFRETLKDIVLLSDSPDTPDKSASGYTFNYVNTASYL